MTDEKIETRGPGPWADAEETETETVANPLAEVNPYAKLLDEAVKEDAEKRHAARIRASVRLLRETDDTRLDDIGKTALFRSVASGIAGLHVHNPSEVFGRRATADIGGNLELLRRLVHGEWDLLDDPDVAEWRKVKAEGEEAAAKFADEKIGGAKDYDNLIAAIPAGDMSSYVMPANDEQLKGMDVDRAERERKMAKLSYDALDEQGKAEWRRERIEAYERKLTVGNPVATFMKMTGGLDDRAKSMIERAWRTGELKREELERYAPKDQRRILGAVSLMRGDQKEGTLLFVPGVDVSQPGWVTNFYAFQQSLMDIPKNIGEAVGDAYDYVRASRLSGAEREEAFRKIDLDAQIKMALKQPLVEAEDFTGAMARGLAENAWFIPTGMAGAWGKGAMLASQGLKAEKGLKGIVQGVKVGLTPWRAGRVAKAAVKEAEAAAELAKANRAAALSKGVKALGEAKVDFEVSQMAMRRQAAAMAKYTEELRKAEQTAAEAARRVPLRIAQWWGGQAVASASDAAMFSSFFRESVEAADAAGVSREESVPLGIMAGTINAVVEHLHMPGQEDNIAPAELRYLMSGCFRTAWQKAGNEGFRKWAGRLAGRYISQTAKVTAEEGFVEEPIQQLVNELGVAIGKKQDELRKEGRGDIASAIGELWDKASADGMFAKTLQIFTDAAWDALPGSLGFGLVSLPHMMVRQKARNVWYGRDEGLADGIQRAIDARAATEAYWNGKGKETAPDAANPHRFEEAMTAARQAFRNPQTRDVVKEVADAAGVDVKTAEVLTDYLRMEAELSVVSPQFSAFRDLNMSLADIGEDTIRTLLPGYVEGSFASDPENGIYSGRVKLDDGSERTIAYRVGDLSALHEESLRSMARADSEFGRRFDANHAKAGDGVTWASLSDAQRYAAAVAADEASFAASWNSRETGTKWEDLDDTTRMAYKLAAMNGFSSGERGVFELTGADGEVVHVNADDVICLANGRLADIGYGAAATQGTVRHETFHALWRFVRGTMKNEDVQALAKTFGIDVTKDGWEAELDETMAPQMERYASGHYVAHAVSEKFDRLMNGWAGKFLGFIGRLGPQDEVTDPKTGKPYQLKGLYDAILRGELGSGALGVELREVKSGGVESGGVNSPTPNSPTPNSSRMPVEVTDADRAEAEEELRGEAAATEPPAPAAPTQPGPAAAAPAAAPAPVQAATSENPADAATPNQVYYRVGLPNSPVKLVGRLEVRDVETGVITSTDEDYHDRGNQNRDDKSEESRALVEKIGANPDPLQIGTVQPMANNGIIWMLPNGDVIIGNHRVNGVRVGYEKGTAAALEKFVREDAAKRGIEIGADVKKPLMVFVLERIESPDGTADVHEVVRLANESQNRGFNVREQASNDAKILVDNNLLPRMAFRADGRIDETKSGDAIGKFRQESGAQGLIAEDGSITEEGQTRIQNAALAVLLGGEGSSRQSQGGGGNNALLNKIMTNAGRLDMQSELRALMKMTPELMALAETKPAYDLRGPLVEALQLFTEWRDKDETLRSEKGKTRHDWRERAKDGHRLRGLSWEMFMSQGDMFRQPSEEAKILGDLFAKAEELRSFDREDVESAAGKKRVIDLISDYLADYIANARAVNTETQDMFGGTPASRAEVMAAQRQAGGEGGGARFSISAEEAQRQYDEVVARYTNKDGTKRRGWMKAPNGKPTRLSERQWVQVRTPAFKAWFGDWEAAELQQWLEGEPVAQATGKEYEGMSRKEIVNAVFENWERVGHSVTNPEVGDVELSRSGIHDSMAHGIGRNKLAAFDFVPEIIANGRVVRFRENWEGRGYDSHIIAAPISIGGKPCVALAVVNKSKSGNRFYLHEVGVIEEIKKYAEVLRTGSSDEKSALSRNLGDVESIALSLFADKGVSKIVDENGEPLVVYRGAPFDPLAQKPGDGVIKPEAYFTADPEYAKRYTGNGGKVRAYYLDIRNPFDVRRPECLADLQKVYPDHNFERGRSGALDWAEASTVDGEFLRDNFGDKYDGIIYDEGGDPGESGVSYRGISYVPIKGGKRVKSATDNSGAFSENPDVRYSIGGIYTGAAADYANRSRYGGRDDGPSLLKIGTGEGSQVYGWGLYGSTVRGVAEGYATPNHLTAEGLAANTLYQYYGNRNDAIEKLQKLVDTGSISYRKLRQDELERARNAISILRNHKEPSRHLYEQTFFTDRAPGDESHLLKWYDAISDANWDRVIAQAEKEGLREKLKGAWWLHFNGDLEHFITDNGNSGDAIYERLSKLLGTPQAASEFLARAGIDGVKYPVDSYGGKGVKDGDAAGWNYVSFRDDNIRVDHKWTDGQMRYSIAVTPEVRKATTVDTADMTRDKADAALRALAGRDLKNDETGIVAQVNSVQRRKILSGVAVQKSADNGFSAEEHNAAASIIEKLWKYASLGKVDGDKNGDPFVKSIKRFVSPVRLGDKDAYAYLTVKESNERGHRIYSIELEKLEALARKLGAQSPAAQSASVPEGTPRSIAQTGAPAQGGRNRYSIAGRKGAENMGIKGAAEAEAMEKAGADREEIWRKTGWWRGRDGKWRIEIPDAKPSDGTVVNLRTRQFKDDNGHYFVFRLGELVDGGQLNSAYPGMVDEITLRFRHDMPSYKATYSPKDKAIELSDRYLQRSSKYADETNVRLSNDATTLIVHELQHAIQQREGFASGADADKLSIEDYHNTFGEVEARNAQTRLGMTAEERAATPPWATEDVPARYQSVGYSGWEWTYADGWRPMAEAAALSPASVRPAAEGRRCSVSAPLVEAMQDRERRENAPRAPQGESPFFAEAEGAVEIPVRALRTVKDEPERSIRSAAFKMRRAAAGRIPKRVPVSVVENGDGTYTVIDGNATTWAAARGGLESVRAKIVGKDRGTRLANSHYLVDNDLSGRDADDILRTHGLDGLTGEAAREKAYEQAGENAPMLKAVVDAAAKAIGCEAKSRKNVKKRQRADEKAALYGNDYSRVVDIIGGTLILDPSQDMTDALKAIRKNLPQGASVAQVKKLSSPDKGGYWDVKVSVRFKNGGIGEIILVDKNILDAKDNRGGHDLYDYQRELDALDKVTREADELINALREVEYAIYSHRTRRAEMYQAAAWERAKAIASSALTRLPSTLSPRLSSEFMGSVKSLLEGSHLQSPASLNSQATPARSFIQNDISDSSPLNGKTSGSISNFPLTVNGENGIGARFSVEAPRSGLVYPQLRSMSDDELLSAAVAVRMALGESEKFSDKVVKINTVQKMMRRLHPDWDTSQVGLETNRVLSGARELGKRIREDIDRGVSESLVLRHLPDTAHEQFGLEMRQEARRGQRLGRFGQRVASELEERQRRLVEDAVRVQTGLDAGAIENAFGINLSETIMHLAENPLSEKPPQGATGAGDGEGTDGDGSVSAEESAGEAEIDAKVKAVVEDILRASMEEASRDARNRADRRAAAGRDAENEKEMGGESQDDEGSVPADSSAGDGDALAAAVAKEGLELENPRHLARFVAELARRQWIQEHHLAKDADVWRDLVAVQFLRKTAQSVYAKLCRDLVYSRSRETAMQRIAKLDAVPTVAGLVSEMEFVGALINAQRIRDTQRELCEKLDLFLRQKFGAQGRFKPDKEEGKRSVSAEAELRARYMRHAMWLTPDAAAAEARQLQETLDALSVDFQDAGRDRDQSREFVETIRKLNVLREFGALRYKPVGEIEAAAQWWEDFARGESDDIVREMSDRDIRTKKAAHLLAVAFADPKRTTIREGGKADALNRFITGHMGFISLLQDCMRHASDADAAAVKDIVDYISREIQKSGDRSEAEKRRHNDAFHAAVEGIYGKSFNAVMKDMMAQDDRFTKFMGVVGGKRVTPTKGRALQLLVSLLQEGRKVQVEDEDNPGQTKTVWEGGYHDNIVKHHREGQAAEIMRLLDPADMNMLKWLGQWYESNRSDLSGVCHSLFGIGVYAELPNYFPVKMMLETQGLEKGQGVGWTIFPKALTPRVRNERDFDTSADIFSMWASRMEEAAQWKHHAQLGLELRGIFGRSELREAVRANHGASVDDLMQGFITDILAGHGAYDRSTAGVQYFSDQIRGWTALCALGGNIGVTAKQTTSIPAFGFEIGLVNTAKYMVSAFTPEGMSAMAKIWDSEQRRTRWNLGSSEAVRNALSQQNAGLLKRMLQKSMITTKLGDVVPALVVGQGIYRDCLDRGMSEEDAMAETWSIIERTQQSGRMENQTSIQRRNKLGRIMFQFLSTQQQYLQYEVRAIREVIARPDSVKRWGSLGRAILLNHFILSSAYYWMGQLYKYALGQEPPEDELKDWIVTCLLGPYGSLFVAGFCCKYTLERAIKGYSIKGGSSMLPMESWLKNQVNDGAKLLEAIFDSDGDTWDNMLEAAGRWMSDSNSVVRDLRKIYRYRIKGEPQRRR